MRKMGKWLDADSDVRYVKRGKKRQVRLGKVRLWLNLELAGGVWSPSSTY